jgi:hypothetical protein
MANPRRRRAIKAAKIAAIRAKRASSSVAAPVKVEEKVEKLMVDEPVIKEEAPKKKVAKKTAPKKKAAKKS